MDVVCRGPRRKEMGVGRGRMEWGEHDDDEGEEGFGFGVGTPLHFEQSLIWGRFMTVLLLGASTGGVVQEEERPNSQYGRYDVIAISGADIPVLGYQKGNLVLYVQTFCHLRIW